MPNRTRTQLFSGQTNKADFLYLGVDFSSSALLVEVTSPTATERNWSRAGNLFEVSTVEGVENVRIFRSRLYFGRELIEFLPTVLPFRLMYAPRDYVIDSTITVWEVPISPNPVTRNIPVTTDITRLANGDPTRKGVALRNFGESTLVLGSLGVTVEPQGYYETPYGYRGNIDGAWVQSGNGFVQVLEFY